MIKIKTITTAIKPYIIRSTATALLALALVTACTPQAEGLTSAHPVPLMPTVTITQATTATVSRLSSFGKEEYPDRGEVVGKATRTTTRASVPITLTSGTLNLTMNGVENPYTLSANGALTSTTPHSVIGADTRTFSVDEAKVTATTASPDITGIAPGLTPTNASLPMNLGVAMPEKELPVAANGAVALPLVHTTAGMRLILKVDDGVSLSAVLSLLSGEEAPTKDAVDVNPSMPTNTDSRIVALTGTSTYAVAFGMLPPATAINAGDLLATITTKTHGSSITKTLALLAPAPLTLAAGQMVTYTVHVGHSVASITGVNITEFGPGNEDGDDLSTGVATADGTNHLDPKIFNDKNPVWVITGDGGNVISNVAAALNGSNGVPAPAQGSIHLILSNFAGAIGDEAFRNCIALASISAPKVTTIKSFAFAGCTALTTISLPAATGINGSIFNGCTALTTISLPGFTNIENSVFANCAALTSISLRGVTNIGPSAFANCIALTRLELTQSTEKMIVSEYAFGLSVTVLPNITLVLNKSVEGKEATIGVKIEDAPAPNVGKKKVTFLNNATFTFAAVEYLSS